MPLTLVIPLAVTAEVPCGLVVLQVKVTLQLLAPEAITQEGDAGVRVPDIAPVLEAEPVLLFVPPLLPLQTQVVLLPDAGKAVLVEVPEAH